MYFTSGLLYDMVSCIFFQIIWDFNDTFDVIAFKNWYILFINSLYASCMYLMCVT